MDYVIYEEESFAMMQKKAKEHGYTFPYLTDATQAVGKNFGAVHTPQAFVIWKVNNQWITKYSGAIDDNGQHPEKATSFLLMAVDALLQNKAVPLPETQSLGCKIYY